VLSKIDNFEVSIKTGLKSISDDLILIKSDVSNQTLSISGKDGVIDKLTSFQTLFTQWRDDFGINGTRWLTKQFSNKSLGNDKYVNEWIYDSFNGVTSSINKLLPMISRLVAIEKVMLLRRSL